MKKLNAALAFLLLLGGVYVISVLKPLEKSEDPKVEKLEMEEEQYSTNPQVQDLEMAEEKKLRIFCLATTCPKYHETKVRAVMNTWGKRCTYIYFVTTQDNKTTDLPLLYAPVEEVYGSSWGKVKFGMNFAYKHFFDKIDWYYKIDDDSYLIYENLVEFLKDKDTNEPVWYGRWINIVLTKIAKRPNLKGYMQGGSGYALSKKAFEMLVTVAFKNSTYCDPGDKREEDWQLGYCLEGLGVPMGVSHDTWGERIHMFDPERTVNPAKILQRVSLNPVLGGLDCCSNTTIVFHYINPDLMVALEFLIYKLKVNIDENLIEHNKEVRSLISL